MNPKLKALFEQYTFSQKEIYDFMQIYNLLPDYKKVAAIENFEQIAKSINMLKKEVSSEYEILFWKALDNIQTAILENKKKSLYQNTRWEVQTLKKMM